MYESNISGRPFPAHYYVFRVQRHLTFASPLCIRNRRLLFISPWPVGIVANFCYCIKLLFLFIKISYNHYIRLAHDASLTDGS